MNTAHKYTSEYKVKLYSVQCIYLYCLIISKYIMFLRPTVALCAFSHLQVIDLSQYSPTYFGPEHAQVLSSHLLHSSLPGLTSIEQMSLMALADTIATTSTDVDSQGQSKGTRGN